MPGDIREINAGKGGHVAEQCYPSSESRTPPDTLEQSNVKAGNASFSVCASTSDTPDPQKCRLCGAGDES